jgi:hypothetical protein
MWCTPLKNIELKSIKPHLLTSLFQRDLIVVENFFDYRNLCASNQMVNPLFVDGVEPVMNIVAYTT